MTLDEWGGIVKLLAAHYPRHPVPAETIAAWYARLERFPAARVREAVNLMAEDTDWPSLAQIVERVGAVRSADQQRAEYARYDTTRMLEEPVVPTPVAKKRIRKILTDLGAKKSMPSSDRDEERRKRPAAADMIREEAV